MTIQLLFITLSKKDMKILKYSFSLLKMVTDLTSCCVNKMYNIQQAIQKIQYTAGVTKTSLFINNNQTHKKNIS